MSKYLIKEDNGARMSNFSTQTIMFRKLLGESHILRNGNLEVDGYPGVGQSTEKIPEVDAAIGVTRSYLIRRGSISSFQKSQLMVMKKEF